MEYKIVSAELFVANKALIIVEHNGRKQRYCINNNGEILFKFPLKYELYAKYDWKEPNKPFRVVYKNKIALMNNEGKLLTKFEYDELELKYSRNSRCIAKCNNKYGLINQEGKQLTEFVYEGLHYFRDNSYTACRDHKFGIIDITGKEILPFEYDSLYGFNSSGFSITKKNDLWGIIDSYTHKEIIPCIYNYISHAHGIYFTAKKDNKFGVIDCYNNVLIPFLYAADHMLEFRSIIVACKDDKYGLIKWNNDTILDFKFDYIKRCKYDEERLFRAKLNGKWGIIYIDEENTKENIVEDFIYDNMISGNGLIIVTKDKKKAIFSIKKMRFITDFIYDDIKVMGLNGLASDESLVLADSQNFLINKYHDIIQCPKIMVDNSSYPYIDDIFNEGVAIIVQDGKQGMVDIAGHVVVPCEYAQLDRCSEGMIRAIKPSGEQGYIDKNNNVVIPFGKYIWGSEFSCGYASVFSLKYESYIYIDRNDKMLEIKF